MGNDMRLSHPQRGRAGLPQHDITTEKGPQLPGGGWISNEETEVYHIILSVIILAGSGFGPPPGAGVTPPRARRAGPAHPWPNHVPGTPWEDQPCSPGWPSQRSRR